MKSLETLIEILEQEPITKVPKGYKQDCQFDYFIRNINSHSADIARFKQGKKIELLHQDNLYIPVDEENAMFEFDFKTVGVA